MSNRGGNDGGNAPSWLFSFVDLAFLLLIAMTQLASEAGSPDLGEIVVPRIRAEKTPEALPERAERRWQVRVHPPAEGTPAFALRLGDGAATGAPAAPAGGPAGRLDAAALDRELAALRDAGEKEPLLAPHADARTQDTLDAVSLLEAHWPGRRRAVVSPRLAQR